MAAGCQGRELEEANFAHQSLYQRELLKNHSVFVLSSCIYGEKLLFRKGSSKLVNKRTRFDLFQALKRQ
jgi:hypothetical protein